MVYPELNLFKLFWMLICIQVVYPGQIIIIYASTWFRNCVCITWFDISTALHEIFVIFDSCAELC